MVKPKSRKNHRATGKKHQNQFSPKADPPDDGDWMVVKKQRITIIIPPLPNKMPSAIHSIGEGQLLLQEKPRSITNSQSPKNTITKSWSPIKTNTQLQCPSANSVSKLSVNEPEKSRSSAEQAAQPPLELHLSEPNVNVENPPSLSPSDNPPFLCHRERNNFGPCSISKARQGMKIFADSTLFMNQRMRASCLEKKLMKAGGLKSWLISLGLARFIKAFEMRRVGKFQLASLTMQKLKDMGTEAVGPRRKLMHAIDCLCEPHCFQHV